MTPNVLSPKLHEQLDALREILKSALLLTEKVSDKESSAILTDRLAHLQSAALFVIVGEVKSGKSSFVNALLGEGRMRGCAGSRALRDPGVGLRGRSRQQNDAGRLLGARVSCPNPFFGK